VSQQPRAIRRNLVVQRWGTPQVTEGSLNEPREREEHGYRFNEKWTYHAPRNDPARPRERNIYWLRYDFVASFIVDREGRLVPEDPRAVLAGLDAREFVPRR
jgi:hypothetical protein